MLKELFPHWEQTDSTEKVWALALHDLSDGELEQAVGSFIIGFTSEFAPKQPAPGDIRKWLHKMVVESTGSGWPEAFVECKEKAMRFVCPIYGTRHDGSFGEIPVTWSSPLVERVFEKFGGSRAFIGLQDGDSVAAAQFRDVYHTTRESMLVRRESIAPLPKPEPRLAIEAPSTRPPPISQGSGVGGQNHAMVATSV